MRRLRAVLLAIALALAGHAAAAARPKAPPLGTPQPAAAESGQDSIVREAKRLTEGSGPAVPPDGASIAFSCNGSAIWILELRCGRTHQVGSLGNAHHPTWSPTGAQLAFSGNGGVPNDHGIWIMNRDGTGLRRLLGARSPISGRCGRRTGSGSSERERTDSGSRRRPGASDER